MSPFHRSNSSTSMYYQIFNLCNLISHKRKTKYLKKIKNVYAKRKCLPVKPSFGHALGKILVVMLFDKEGIEHNIIFWQACCRDFRGIIATLPAKFVGLPLLIALTEIIHVY